MPQIGWFEILIVVVLSILIIGPKDFPVMLKKLGSWIGSFKNYFNDIQSDISDLDNTIDLNSDNKIRNKEETNKSRKDE